MQEVELLSPQAPWDRAVERLLAGLEKLSDTSRRDRVAPELIDAAGVAVLLGIGERTARRLDVEGQLPRPIKIGGSIRWRLSELRQWLDAGAPPRQKWEAIRERI